MPRPSKFKATIKLSGKTVQLGYFSSPELANVALVNVWKAAREAA
jgi:hypothetical protein